MSLLLSFGTQDSGEMRTTTDAQFMAVGTVEEACISCVFYRLQSRIIFNGIVADMLLTAGFCDSHDGRVKIMVSP